MFRNLMANLRESMLIKGYALNCTIAARQMPRSIANAKIACLHISLQKVKMKMGVQMFVSDPDQLDNMVTGVND